MISVNKLSFWKRVLLRVIVFFVRIFTLTIRIKIDEKSLEIIKNAQPNTIFLFWHNQLFLIWKFHNYFNKKLQMYGLVSPSKDGAWLEAIFDIFNIKSIRGSSKRRGLEAIDEMAEVLKTGACIAITPDGPRGPVYKMKPGTALLLPKTNSHVVVLKINYSKQWTLKTWDKFLIPKPFSTATLSPIIVADGFHEGLTPQEITEKLEKVLLTTI